MFYKSQVNTLVHSFSKLGPDYYLPGSLNSFTQHIKIHDVEYFDTVAAVTILLNCGLEKALIIQTTLTIINWKIQGMKRMARNISYDSMITDIKVEQSPC